MELIRQQDKYDCGVANCVMIINHFNSIKTTIEDFKLTHKYQREEYSLEDIKSNLSKYDIGIEYYEIESINRIVESRNYPILLVIKNNEGFNHYVLINNYENGMFDVYDPSFKLKKKLTIKQLKEMSLNIVGYIRKTDRYKDYEIKQNFNKKYALRFWILFKQGWKSFILINLISVVILFSYFFSNMFIKVLLTEYPYLTFKRSILLVLVFIGIVSVWFILFFIQRRFISINDQRCINKYFSCLDNNYDLSKTSNAFNKEQKVNEISNLLVVVRQQLYLINNSLGFLLFTIAVIYLTAHISIVLLTGTLLLMLILFCLKIWQAKRNYSGQLISRIHSNRTNSFINNLVDNFESINQKINLENYLDLYKERLNKSNTKSNDLIMYLEKISIYLYYFLMIFSLYNSGLDISLFLVVTNITFVFSHHLETVLTNLNSSFIVNKKLKIINNLKEIKLNDSLSEKLNIKVKNTLVRNNVVRVKNLEQVLINHRKIKNLRDNRLVFNTELDLVPDETVSNNLFNYGQNNGLENYQKFRLNKWIEKLNIDLSLKTYYLNQEQIDFIKLTSCLFTNKRIITIKKMKYKWFLIIEKDIKKYLKDKVVIVYG